MHVVTVIEICSPKVRMSWKKKEFFGLDLDCKTVGFFFSKSVKKSVTRGVRVLRARSARASTARVYLNTQKYGLFCGLD